MFVDCRDSEVNLFLFLSKWHSNQQWNLLNINRDFLVKKRKSPYEGVIQNKTPRPPRVNVWLYLVQKQQKTAGEKASRHSIVNFTKLKCDNTEPSISPISFNVYNSYSRTPLPTLPTPSPPPLLHLEPVDSRAMSPDEALMDRM